MTSRTRKILDDTLALPHEERRVIAIALRDSIAPAGAADEVDAAWRDELARRARRVDSERRRLARRQRGLPAFAREVRTLKRRTRQGMTPPEAMHWLFWDVDLQELQVERHADYILSRALERGRLDDVTWALRTYGEPRIHAFLRE